MDMDIVMNTEGRGSLFFFIFSGIACSLAYPTVYWFHSHFQRSSPVGWLAWIRFLHQLHLALDKQSFLFLALCSCVMLFTLYVGQTSIVYSDRSLET
ncbi:hypothetical protein BO78DRAFT_5092 [Aspergillus sclerotiicarbonarius CBS 121057]|uniref:Uncharacterized protein n=1 Tax=Aspergillus sclerotiicarbonarius (strain CBS 121057 / IBT 28362) TaxID=1448318 RepID=A0A319EQC1_ASPSB|nr:hypothetical protein BO78DRAFT_5092 [Aspergillus sclerotiicarbonarius CBS 121057]